MTGTPKLGDARVVAEIVLDGLVFYAELYREIPGRGRGWERSYGEYHTADEAATVARNLSEKYKVSLRYDKIRNAIEENGPVTVYEYENGELGGEHWFL